MFKCECVCKRRRKLKFGTHEDYVISKEYKKLMRIIGTALKAGKQVIMEHKIIEQNGWYDKVTVTIK